VRQNSQLVLYALWDPQPVKTDECVSDVVAGPQSTTSHGASTLHVHSLHSLLFLACLVLVQPETVGQVYSWGSLSLLHPPTQLHFDIHMQINCRSSAIKIKSITTNKDLPWCFGLYQRPSSEENGTNFSSGSCHGSVVTWQEICHTRGSVCSCPHPGS